MAFAAAAALQQASQKAVFFPAVTRLRHSFQCNQSWKFGLLQSSAASSQVRSFAVRANIEQPPRTFVNYTIYKGKAALALAPGKPTFKQVEENSYALAREGSVFLEFASASGSRRYDWEKKQIFALSPLEMGTLIDCSPGDSLDFTHDPNLGKPDEGKVLKRMKISPLSNPDGFYFALTVKDEIQKVNTQVGIPVSRGEFAVIKSIFNYIIPHLLGWGVHVNPSGISNVLVEGSVGDMAPDKILSPQDTWKK